VKNSEEKEVCAELEDLLLPYAAGALTGEERAMVEKHMHTCTGCSRELTALHKMTAILRENEEALCPDPVELYEYANFGEDPTGLLAAHLARCPHCSAAVEEYKTAPEDASMPEDLWNRIRIDQQGSEQSPSSLRAYFAGLFQWLSSFPGFPVLALGTAAAMILMVVVFYPGIVPQPEPSFSTVTWVESNDGLLPKRIGPAPPGGRLAMVIYLSGFEQPVSQERVDELYLALKPTTEMEKRFQVLPPAELIRAFRGTQTGGERRELMLQRLKHDLRAAKVLIFTVGPEESGLLHVDGELVDLQTGKTVRGIIEKGVRDSELPSRLRRSELELLRE
jgi:hypothetical protein